MHVFHISSNVEDVLQGTQVPSLKVYTSDHKKFTWVCFGGPDSD